MKVTSQNKELLDSRTFLALGLGETVVSIGEGPEKLRFVLNFVQDEEKPDKEKKQQLKFEPSGKNSLKITLTNWDNVLGTTFKEPVEVGTFSGKMLFIMILVKKAGSVGEVREVNFSAYLGDEVQDGND